ncbi:MAG: hypothetical protein EOO41_03710, partial [Methanobacteriota archaeon]
MRHSLSNIIAKIRRVVLQAAAVALQVHMAADGFAENPLESALPSTVEPQQVFSALSPARTTAFSHPAAAKYTMRAAARSYCRRLMRFVRLTDFSIFVSLQQLAQNATQHLLMVLSAHDAHDRRLRLEAIAASLAAGSRHAGAAAAMAASAVAAYEQKATDTAPGLSHEGDAAAAACGPAGGAVFLTDLHTRTLDPDSGVDFATPNMPRMRVQASTDSFATSSTGGEVQSSSVYGMQHVDIPPLHELLAQLSQRTRPSMEGLMLVPGVDTFRSRVEAAIMDALRIVASSMSAHLLESDDFHLLRLAVLSRDDMTAASQSVGRSLDATGWAPAARAGTSGEEASSGSPRSVAGRAKGSYAAGVTADMIDSLVDMPVQATDATEALEMLLADPTVADNVTNVHQVLQSAFDAGATQLGELQQYRNMAVVNGQLQCILDKAALGKLAVVDLHTLLDDVQRQIGACADIPESVHVSQLLRVDAVRFKRVVQP